MAFNNFKEITLEDMMNYIDEYAPDFKEEFKEAALINLKDGTKRYNAAKAKKAFCIKFMPELLPKTSKPISKTEMLLNW